MVNAQSHHLNGVQNCDGSLFCACIIPSSSCSELIYPMLQLSQSPVCWTLCLQLRSVVVLC